MSKICADLGEQIKPIEKPNGYKEGVTLTFQVTNLTIVSIEENSLNLAGWNLEKFSTKITKDGSAAYFTLYNAFYQGDLNELKLQGSIAIGIGSKPETRIITLKDGDQPIKLPDFTIQTADKRNGVISGVRLKGKLGMLKSIKVENNGQELKRNGYSRSGDDISYYYQGLTEKSKVTIIYWTKIKKKTVTINK